MRSPTAGSSTPVTVTVRAVSQSAAVNASDPGFTTTAAS